VLFRSAAMWSTAEIMNLLLVTFAAAPMSLTSSRLRLTHAPCSPEKTGYPLALGRRALSSLSAWGVEDHDAQHHVREGM
jgi:hypothetical protein